MSTPLPRRYYLIPLILWAVALVLPGYITASRSASTWPGWYCFMMGPFAIQQLLTGLEVLTSGNAVTSSFLYTVLFSVIASLAWVANIPFFIVIMRGLRRQPSASRHLSLLACSLAPLALLIHDTKWVNGLVSTPHGGIHLWTGGFIWLGAIGILGLIDYKQPRPATPTASIIPKLT